METKTYSFVFSPPEFEKNVNWEIFKKILDSNGFKEEKINKNKYPLYLDYINIYSIPSPYLYNINSKLKNVLDDKEITLKNNLYKNSLKKNKTLTKEYFLDTYEYDKRYDVKYKKLFSNQSNQSNIWIIKKNNLMAGLGNFIVKDYEEFIEVTKKLKSGFIINKYMTNPLLVDGRKFHLRMFMINFVDKNKVTRTWFSRYGRILTAKEKYENDDYLNPLIHDSHLKTTDKERNFPNDFSKEFNPMLTRRVFVKMKEIIKYITTFQNLYNYSETENGYAINGCDFMISNEESGYEVKLLEINDQTGFPHFTKQKYLFNNIYNEIFTKVFNLKPIKVKENFIRIS
jgi:hypothetical protein